MPRPKLRVILLTLLVTIAGGSLTLPWIHHHDHLRDFMDYGLVMAGNARLAAGERPYVDFTTPIQAGFLALNQTVERLTGGTYLGLTYGALASALGGFGLLVFISSRRWPIWAATLVGWATIAGSVSQHTIIWHNSLGVLCVALNLWLIAIRPTVSRPDWLWHLSLAAILFVGGVNKLNFQLVALAGTACFALRAGLLGNASWRQVLATLALIACAGITLPLAFELSWTGATWTQWRYNVIDLAAGGRATYLSSLFDPTYYLAPLHDYYHPLHFPQIGGLSVIIAVGLFIWGFPARSWGDRGLLLVACLAVPTVTMALILTNLEIIYIAGSAGLAVAVAVALGFNIKPEGRGLTQAIALPGLVLGGFAWTDAYAGARSQFGHSESDRQSYQELSALAPEYAYLAGVKIPPEMAQSYAVLGPHLPAAAEHGLRPVFYAAGVEWLEHIWPATKIHGLPLWLHEGTSYGDAERKRLARLVSPPSKFALIVTAPKWDYWPPSAYIPVDLFTRPEPIGTALRLRHPTPTINTDHDTFYLLNLLGANFLAELMRFGDDTVFAQTADDRVVFGRQIPGTGSFYFDGVVNRMAGEFVLRRDPLSEPTAAFGVDFSVHYEAEGDWHLITSQRVEIPVDQSELRVPYEFDGRQRPLRFSVTLPPTSDGSVLAGWHSPQMQNSIPSDQPPPRLFSAASADTAVAAGLQTALVTADWIPDALISRGAVATANGLELEPGDQIWLRANEALKALDGYVQVAEDVEGAMPYVCFLWYQGGRVVIFDQFEISSHERRRNFHAWTPGTQGWFGIAVYPYAHTSPLTLRIDQVIPE
jgi:hypothetical protein